MAGVIKMKGQDSGHQIANSDRKKAQMAGKGGMKYGSHMKGGMKGKSYGKKRKNPY